MNEYSFKGKFMTDFQEKLKQARRDQIIDAAITVIADKGFQKTTIRDIAGNAGIADGTIYNYFKNKDAIMLGIMSRLTEAEVRDIHFAEAGEMEFSQFTPNYVAHRMREVDDNFQIFKAILPELITNNDLSRKINDELFDPAFAVAEKYMQKLIDDGKMPTADPAIVARLFAAPLFGLLMLRLFGDQHVTENWEKYGEAMGQLILTTLQK
jgi:AcrR family transcriptional regulator